LTALPDTERTRAALASLDALVVLDVVSSDLTELATHVLPVVGQLERDDISMLENVAFANGTQHTTAVVAPGAQRRPVWWVLGELARRLDFDVLGGIEPDQCTDDTLLRALAAGSRGGYEAIIAGGPHGVSASPQYGWVHERVLPGGRWRIAPTFLVSRLAAAAPVGRDEGGLVLVPRRRVRSMNSARYVAADDVARDPAEIRLNPGDAAVRSIDDGARVRVVSANGELEGTARVDPNVRPGVVSCTHGVAAMNVARLTSATTDLDPETAMPRASGVPVLLVPNGPGGA